MTTDDLVLLEEAKSPLVMLDSYFPQAEYWTVGIANIEAGYKAGEYLIKNGHRTIGLITSKVQFNNMDERQYGFRQALAQAGLDLQPRFQVTVEPTINGCEKEFKNWLDQANSLPRTKSLA